LQQADESATTGHLRRRPATHATRALVNTPANVTGRADDAASPPRAAAPAFPDPARSADDGIPATAHSLQAPARPRWRGGREGRQRQPSRPSRDQPPAWPPSSMQPRQESSARRSPPPPSLALRAFAGSNLRGWRGRGDQGREAAAAGVRVSPPGRLKGGDARGGGSQLFQSPVSSLPPLGILNKDNMNIGKLAITILYFLKCMGDFQVSKMNITGLNIGPLHLFSTETKI
jgi:hypothetical protein